MNSTYLHDPSFKKLIAVLFLLLLNANLAQAQAVAVKPSANLGTPEQRTARYFESIRRSPPQMLAFLLRMPKGGDLHNHLSGGIYAESFIQWAADKKMCVNQTTLALTPPPCDPEKGLTLVSNALTNGLLYRQLIDTWSMRNWQPGPLPGQNGHDHFFDAFAKFGGATTGQMLSEAVARAAKGQVSYMEIMLTPASAQSTPLGMKVGWDGDFAGTLKKLKSNGLADAVAEGIKALQQAEAEKDSLLKCGTPQADAGCKVTVRYVAQVSRGAALGVVFAQMATGFALANDPNSKVVGVNLVQPEDALPAMQNFSLQMEMLAFLRPLYPQAHLTLHAGELAPGSVPPAGMRFHIRDSVLKAQAERIGHGVDIMNEDDSYQLLKEMARRRVMVEICLTSNDVILGIRRAQHPLATYLQYGVPMALATDDEGVSRSEISREFLKAAEDHGLSYPQLKAMARNSLEHAFLPGKSLWADTVRFRPVPVCASIAAKSCQQYLANSEKARLQWQLEEAFAQFERQLPK